MLQFATEFPVKAGSSRAYFVAEVVSWIRGMQAQTVLSEGAIKDLDGPAAHLKSNSGEELRLRELQSTDGWVAVGFRHDLPDDGGRIWRTEGVLKRAAAESGQDLVRIRTQCLRVEPEAPLDTPRKPYLIKALLKNQWGGTDRSFRVSDAPIFLGKNSDSISIAKSVAFGDATTYLPIVYVSATDKSSWLLSPSEINNVAYDLGGVAHVVVEPDRKFSFSLRDKTEGRNVYGGMIGLSIPGRGFAVQFLPSWFGNDRKEFSRAVRAAALSSRTSMPALGWDWTELQEQALHAHRERDRKQLSAKESEKLYQDEIDNLHDRIKQLEQQLNVSPGLGVAVGRAELLENNLVQRVGPEIYEGEIADRLRHAAKTALSVSESIGLDERSKVILSRIVERIPESPARAELIRDLERASKDPKRAADQLSALLARHGYFKKSSNKHIRLEAGASYDGLGPITLSKTPSDYRGIKNMCSQIERTLGINKRGD